ncbi:predicted protein [Uncinocarpus reesii 1704]|uniref:NTF2 domain-containing protein n=1 Tax=Uncinocarpus reesii (strain UAMH 1704) TaxID=336963 RepID=C4JJU1_UNCRE|nr:uncharacterized protein UREG_01898 [Uncinocarpus reesii 1704]EEP77049.1 predicted protein [Uncinocarpus reesii 1704]
MATEAATHLNGTYAHHQSGPYHTDPYHNVNASAHHQPSNASTPAPAQQESKSNVPKDEVAWFFVEQYYTTLSRNPDKLHLFYSRKSQFVSGDEAEKVSVAVGQHAIQDRIKSLDYHDTKVRVLNVDSQATFDSILVSVIGELSNKSEPPRKFVQTFVLAEQRNGYYVLNDIIRFLVDDDEEIITDEQVPDETPSAKAPVEQVEVQEEATPEQPDNGRQADTEAAVQEVDEKLVATAKEPEPKTEEAEAAVEPKQVTEPSTAPVPTTAEALEQEKPKEPEPTPIVSPSKAATPVVEKENIPPVKPASMSWASIASSNTNKAAAVATPVAVPHPVPVAQPRAAPVPAPSQPAQPTVPANGETAPSQTSSSSGSEWQTAGRGRDENVLAYIKNVNEKVDAALLKQTLQRFGKLKYFDVSRQRSCAFVEFADAAGYKAAVAANPHQIGTERITVEERRPRPNAYGGNGSYGPGRGGAGRGRGDRTASQGRGGFQKDSGRFTPRGGRGGTITPKGRPQSQAA